MTIRRSSGTLEGSPPSPEAPKVSLPWSRLAGKDIVEVYVHDTEPEAGGGWLFWYDCADGESIPIYSPPYAADSPGIPDAPTTRVQ